MERSHLNKEPENEGEIRRKLVKVYGTMVVRRVASYWWVCVWWPFGQISLTLVAVVVPFRGIGG